MCEGLDGQRTLTHLQVREHVDRRADDRETQLGRPRSSLTGAVDCSGERRPVKAGDGGTTACTKRESNMNILEFLRSCRAKSGSVRSDSPESKIGLTGARVWVTNARKLLRGRAGRRGLRGGLPHSCRSSRWCRVSAVGWTVSPKVSRS